MIQVLLDTVASRRPLARRTWMVEAGGAAAAALAMGAGRVGHGGVAGDSVGGGWVGKGGVAAIGEEEGAGWGDVGGERRDGAAAAGELPAQGLGGGGVGL